MAEVVKDCDKGRSLAEETITDLMERPNAKDAHDAYDDDYDEDYDDDGSGEIGGGMDGIGGREYTVLFTTCTFTSLQLEFCSRLARYWFPKKH
ncbi:hypothetical protein BOVATA_023670 [Babesia ovata]|uniref:Uncharacterized protein n=1 Tax=Babesia ovata TaxID=189622 RepID=A0A2H6KD19_9APIC|nr:uncharacterized protein BOVATA_023670 [Babesia ovata]GBE60874.1 hypothetical protein BOVATA_023670 [Babesia ovata]